MNLLNLAARVCRAFAESGTQQMRTVQKVKDNQVRDVVTALDMRLHDISRQFVEEHLPNCRLLSEEGEHDRETAELLLEREWLIVDPLDGSNNQAVGLPNYGYMAAHIRQGWMTGTVIVLPEHNQYIVMEDSATVYAQAMPRGVTTAGNTVYYAYPPKQDAQARIARGLLQDLIDANSAGLYRYGSACAGLYHLLCGKHLAFIGHGIRLWDAVAFLPILASHGIEVRYCIRGLIITLVASARVDFVNSAVQILEQDQCLTLHRYCIDSLLRIDAR